MTTTLIQNKRGRRRTSSATVPFNNLSVSVSGIVGGSQITPGPANSGKVGRGIVGIMVVGQNI